MNITKLSNSQITLLEIFLNNYKQFRILTQQVPQKARARKLQEKRVKEYNSWLQNNLKNKQQMFLLKYGILDVMTEVRHFISANYSTPKLATYELQML